MNINYHYYTIKTLACHAGFDDKTAQFIAYFSQQIDDYIMGSPFITGTKPPDFFIKNRLALELNKDKWVFLPCPTGINVIKSISHNNQLYTLMPFHFIMSKPKDELYNTVSNRSSLRCVAANECDSLLINNLMKQTVRETDVNDKFSLMALGMLLHTYADTYAHCGFSGFHGWENESFVSKMEHKIPRTENPNIFTRAWRTAKEKILGKQDPHDAMSPGEISFFRNLPSIGHGNVGSAPDYCECSIVLYAKKDEDSKMEPFIERDNSEFFAGCSRRIINMLCEVNKKPLLKDDEWKVLQEKLSDAQNVRRQLKKTANKQKWAQVFPDITYNYSKKEYVSIKLKTLKSDKEVMDKLEIGESDLEDIYSEQGEQARAASFMFAANVSDLYYKYNELAYEHVRKVTGKYASAGNYDKLSNYHARALKNIN
ncbi:MAG: hypothetical protein FWC36_03340 [Spirochaetes bacterium]|nr:hypothetical protein [Spirochaetota bacterium]